jgi:hypothetical protein
MFNHCRLETGEDPVDFLLELARLNKKVKEMGTEHKQNETQMRLDILARLPPEYNELRKTLSVTGQSLAEVKRQILKTYRERVLKGELKRSITT